MWRVAALLFIFSSACFAADLSISGWRNPKTYLEEFPLGISQTDFYNQVGPPHASFKMGDSDLWVYAIGGDGPRYTFEIKAGAVAEVQYKSPMGMHDGLTASAAQAAMKR